MDEHTARKGLWMLLGVGMFIVLLGSFAIVSASISGSGIWTRDNVTESVALNNTNDSVCLGDTCYAGWQLTIEHNASIAGSQICTAGNGVCSGTNNTMWNDTGTAIILADSTRKVGIGTDTPNYNLEVVTSTVNTATRSYIASILDNTAKSGTDPTIAYFSASNPNDLYPRAVFGVGHDANDINTALTVYPEFGTSANEITTHFFIQLAKSNAITTPIGGMSVNPTRMVIFSTKYKGSTLGNPLVLSTVSFTDSNGLVVGAHVDQPVLIGPAWYDYGSQLFVKPVSATREGIYILGHASQTADLFSIKEGFSPYRELFMVSADGKVGIGTSSPQQELNVIGDLNVTGELDFQRHYAQTAYHNETDPLVIDLITEDVYYNVSGLHVDYSEGINTSGMPTITASGMYQLVGSISFSGGNSGKYRYNLFVNDVEEHACGAMRTTTSTSLGSMSINCLVQLEVDDTVNMRVKDTTSPVQDVNIYTLTFNMIKI